MKKLLLLLVVVCSSILYAQPGFDNTPPTTTGPRVAWYGNWEQGLAVARATNRPIFLVSAAVQCHGVSGIW